MEVLTQYVAGSAYAGPVLVWARVDIGAGIALGAEAAAAAGVEVEAQV